MSPDPATIELDRLFPATVRTVLSLRIPAEARLEPTETPATANFSAKRLVEFRHGRYCARQALLRLGAESVAIPIGGSREPRWPEGLTGSISHAGDAAAAAVAWQSDVGSLGLDLEPDLPLEEELVPRICRPDEIAREVAVRTDPGLTIRLLFSAKEATYKALWPLLGRFLDFHDLAVTLDERSTRFTVTSPTTACPRALLERIDGRFTRTNGLVATGATLRTTVGR